MVNDALRRDAVMAVKNALVWLTESKGIVGFSWYYIATRRTSGAFQILTDAARTAESIVGGGDPTGLLTVRIRNV